MKNFLMKRKSYVKKHGISSKRFVKTIKICIVTASIFLYSCTSETKSYSSLYTVDKDLDKALALSYKIRVEEAYWRGYREGLDAQFKKDKEEVAKAVKTHEGLKKYLNAVGNPRFVLVRTDSKEIIPIKKARLARRRK